MGKAQASLEALLVALLSPMVAHALCNQSALSIDTTTLLSVSGCYYESPYAGLYETKVWTIDGRDIAETGTKAIVADLQNGPLADPVWVIGSVVSLPSNTWSDGYNAGLEVVDLVCKGTSTFWETKDPTVEIKWSCDSDADGVPSTGESGDFTAIACGCPVAATPAPTTMTRGVTGETTAPVAAVVPTPAPSLTKAPIPQEPSSANQTTPAPSIGGVLSPTAAACNLTLASTDLDDVSGCYVGRESSNARARWVKPDETASIEWQEAGDATDEGNWAMVFTGVGVPDETRCIATEDVDDPTEISAAQWYCDLEGDGSFTSATSFDFEGLTCGGSCEITSAKKINEDSSDGGTGKTIAIVIGSVGSGVVLTALIIIAAICLRRTKRGAKTKGVESIVARSADPKAPEPIPVFEPWGTRPAPRYYG